MTTQSVTQASDGQGGFTETWANGDTVWASIEPLNGRERYQAMQMQTPVTHKIVMRYKSGVTTAQRLAWDGRTFEIKEVINPGEQNSFLEIKAIERS